jgi:23S rRNA pseudoU1915 N3-methylase RlmH
MKIDVCYGGEKLPRYYAAAIGEYKKRLSTHLDIRLLSAGQRPAQQASARFVRISKTGAMYSSEQLAAGFAKLTANGVSKFVVFAGCGEQAGAGAGAGYGVRLTEQDISAPLALVLLYEQIYRIMKIIGGDPYHR